MKGIFVKRKVVCLCLVLVMLLGICPMNSFAESGNVFHGVDVRVQSIAPSVAIGDAQILIKGSTDEYASKYQETEDIDMIRSWYYMYNKLSDIPEDEDASGYSQFTYADGSVSMYIKPINDTTVHFEADRLYVCIMILQTMNGAEFAFDCQLSSDGAFIQTQTEESMCIVLVVEPDEEVKTTSEIPVEVDYAGNLTLPEIDGNYMYLYRQSDGSDNELTYDNPVGEIVGTRTVNASDFVMLTSDRININNGPYVQIILIEREDLAYNKTVKILGYGDTVSAMLIPYIVVDELHYDTPVNVVEVGDHYYSTPRKYSNNIAWANFEGWYEDEDGTISCETAKDAYAVFNMVCIGGFDPDTVFADFIVTTGEFSFVASKFEKISYTTVRVSFFVPYNRITATVTVSGETSGVNAWFDGTDYSDSITLLPDSSGSVKAFISFEYPASVYVKNITVNGIDWTDKDNGYLPKLNTFISITDEMREGIIYPELTSSAVIDIEFALCDVITIEYGDAKQADWTDETRGHHNATYYAPENIGIKLCDGGFYYNNTTQRMHLYEFNTKPDGTGYSVTPSPFDRCFYWSPFEEYLNGERDYITLYARLMCNAHTNIEDDEAFWQYHDAEVSICNGPGCAAYRQCQYCGIYQILRDGEWITVNIDEVFFDSIPHDYTYIDNGDGTHTAVCSRGDSTFSEEHTFDENDRCICGAENVIYPEPNDIIGDINLDGAITGMDSVLLLRIIAEWNIAENICIDHADVNRDGEVNGIDATLMLQYLAAWFDEFPTANT